jgi:hypothetical protein
MKKRNFLSLAGAVPMGMMLTGCGGSSASSAKVRLLNASVGYSGLDLYWNGSSVLSSVAYGTVSDFAGIDAGTYSAALYSAGGSSQLSVASRTFSKDVSYTVVAYGWSGALASTIITENIDAAASGSSTVSVLNSSVDSGALDFYLTGQDDLLSASTPQISSLAGGSRSTSTTMAAGTYRLRVTGAGDTTDLRLDVSNVTVASTGVYTFILTPGPGGVLVNSVMLQQGGAATAQLNTQARVRVVAGMAAGAKVTVQAGSTVLTSNSASPAITNYVLVNAGSVIFNASVEGNSLASQTVTLSPGSDATVVVAGNTVADAVMNVIDDVNRLPAVSTSYKMRMIHASPTYMNQALTLTVDLEDLADNVAFAQGSSFSSQAATTGSELTVSSLSSSTAIYDVLSQSYLANGVYTVFVYDTAAGVTTAKVKKDR